VCRDKLGDESGFADAGGADESNDARIVAIGHRAQRVDENVEFSVTADERTRWLVWRKGFGVVGIHRALLEKLLRRSAG
jgi:hypothetical protein